MYEILVVAITVVFGLCAGSFLNVCIWRLPREGLSVSKPRRSFCPSCEAKISWRDNIPVLSWLLLRGRCRACEKPISIRYPLVELLTAAVCALVVWRFHLQIQLGVLEQQPGLGVVVSCIALLALVCALLVAAFVDADLRILPDEITVGGMHFVLLAMLVFQDLRFSLASKAAERALPGNLVPPSIDTTGGHSITSMVEGAVRDALGWLSGILPGWELSTGPAIAALALLVLFFFFSGCFCYHRYRRWRLPDESNGFFDVSLAGLLCALSAGLLGALCVLPGFEDSRIAYNLASTLLGMLTGSGLVFLIGVVGTFVFRKPAMGFGDVKLMGLLGGLAGCWGALTAFFLACILGSIVGIPRRLISGDRHLSFGPFLIISGVFVYLWPDAVDSALDWYSGLFSG